MEKLKKIKSRHEIIKVMMDWAECYGTEIDAIAQFEKGTFHLSEYANEDRMYMNTRGMWRNEYVYEDENDIIHDQKKEADSYDNAIINSVKIHFKREGFIQPKHVCVYRPRALAIQLFFEDFDWKNVIY